MGPARGRPLPAGRVNKHNVLPSTSFTLPSSIVVQRHLRVAHLVSANAAVSPDQLQTWEALPAGNVPASGGSGGAARAANCSSSALCRLSKMRFTSCLWLCGLVLPALSMRTDHSDYYVQELKAALREKDQIIAELRQALAAQGSKSSDSDPRGDQAGTCDRL